MVTVTKSYTILDSFTGPASSTSRLEQPLTSNGSFDLDDTSIFETLVELGVLGTCLSRTHFHLIYRKNANMRVVVKCCQPQGLVLSITPIALPEATKTFIEAEHIKSVVNINEDTTNDVFCPCRNAEGDIVKVAVGTEDVTKYDNETKVVFSVKLASTVSRRLEA